LKAKRKVEKNFIRGNDGDAQREKCPRSSSNVLPPQPFVCGYDPLPSHPKEGIEVSKKINGTTSSRERGLSFVSGGFPNELKKECRERGKGVFTGKENESPKKFLFEIRRICSYSSH